MISAFCFFLISLLRSLVVPNTKWVFKKWWTSSYTISSSREAFVCTTGQCRSTRLSRGAPQVPDTRSRGLRESNSPQEGRVPSLNWKGLCTGWHKIARVWLQLFTVLSVTPENYFLMRSSNKILSFPYCWLIIARLWINGQKFKFKAQVKHTKNPWFTLNIAVSAVESSFQRWDREGRSGSKKKHDVMSCDSEALSSSFQKHTRGPCGGPSFRPS